MLLRLVLAGLVVVATSSRQASAQEPGPGAPALLHGLLPAVVNILAVARGPLVASSPAEVGQGSTGEPHITTGSGFVIDQAGLIVTNFHVVDGAYEITVTLADQTRYPAHVRSASRATDIALLSVQVGHPLPTTRWGDSDKVRVGDPVIAIGNPLGIGQSVTTGIVSGLNRNIMETPYDDFIQTDAAINHGNSGGPLFNMKGQVIGINTAIVSPTSGSAGLGFAIPANDASFIVGRLRQFGSLHPGYLGVKLQQVTPEMARALGLAQPRGSIVAYVVAHGPAEAAGLLVGDVVTSIRGHVASDERALLRMIAEAPDGQVLGIGVLRDGRAVELTATVSRWPKDRWAAMDSVTPSTPPPVFAPPDLGLGFAPLGAERRGRLGLAPEEGLVIAEVAAGSSAAEHGIRPGDVLLRIGGTRVGAADQVPVLQQQRVAAGALFVMVLVWPETQASPGPSWHALRIGE